MHYKIFCIALRTCTHIFLEKKCSYHSAKSEYSVCVLWICLQFIEFNYYIVFFFFLILMIYTGIFSMTIELMRQNHSVNLIQSVCCLFCYLFNQFINLINFLYRESFIYVYICNFVYIFGFIIFHLVVG